MFELKLAARSAKEERSCFKVGNVNVGKEFLMIAGPCSIESEEQMLEAAKLVKEAGANMLRGGAYKPRTSPYSFQGLGEEGLVYLRKAGDAFDLPVITEAVDPRDVVLVAEYADVIQIGARNMQNYALLEEVGKINKPVLLKRGTNATVEELLNSAEYILAGGNEEVMLCERGIRTFETYTRNTLDLSAVAALKELTHLPVIVDPSHATGRREMIRSMSLAAVMACCDGLEIEMHPNPEKALSDSDQQLSGGELKEILAAVVQTVDFKKSMMFASEKSY